MQDYAQGIEITAPEALPLVEATVPDACIRARRAQISATCACSTPTACSARLRLRRRPSPRSREALPVFQLREAPTSSGGARIELQTAGGTQVNVPGRSRPAAGRERPHIHIIDARDSDDPACDAVRMAEPGRRVAGAGQHRSDRWRVFVTLAVNEQPRRERIELPTQRTTTCACSERTAVRRSRSIA